MKKIKIQSRLTIVYIYLLAVITIIVGAVLVSYKPDDIFGYIIMFSFVIVFFFNKKDDVAYVSDINIDESYIEIIYKKNRKIVNRIKINKSSIVCFDVNIHIIENIFHNIVSHKTEVNIALDNGTCTNFKIETNNYELGSIFGTYYQPIINLIIAHNMIPNFKYEVTGSEYVTQELKKYYEQGKGFSFWEHITLKSAVYPHDKFSAVFVLSAISITIIALICIVLKAFF